MTSPGSPSITLRPKSITTRRRATDISACTTCSIQMIVTPVDMNVANRVQQRNAFAIGQASRNFVQKQQSRIGSERAGQFETLALQQGQRCRLGICACPHVGQSHDIQRAFLGVSAARPNVAPTRMFSNTVMPTKGWGT